MENLELINAMYANFESGDMERWRTLVSPNCVFTISGDLQVTEERPHLLIFL